MTLQPLRRAAASLDLDRVVRLQEEVRLMKVKKRQQEAPGLWVRASCRHVPEVVKIAESGTPPRAHRGLPGLSSLEELRGSCLLLRQAVRTLERH